MSLRVWLYDTLRQDPGISALVADRIHEGESLGTDLGPITRPFIVYRFGNTSPDNRFSAARRQNVTIYIHDEGNPGSYLRIDQIEKEVKRAMRDAPPAPAYDLLEARWLETSADFDDREMGTILRYSRFALVTSTWNT